MSASEMVRVRRLNFPKVGDLSAVCLKRLNSLDCESKRVRKILSGNRDLTSAVSAAEFWQANSSRLVHPAAHPSVSFQRGIAERRVCTHSDAYRIFRSASAIYPLAISSRENFQRWLTGVASAATGERAELRTFEVGITGMAGDKLVSFSHPSDIEDRLEELRGQLCAGEFPPVGGAIFAQAVLLNIHPFADGNGRVARALFSCHLNADPKLDELFLPLSIVNQKAHGAYEIKVRDVEANGNWISLVDYFSEILGVISESAVWSARANSMDLDAVVEPARDVGNSPDDDLLSRLCSSRELQFNGPMSHSLGHGLPLSMLCMSDDYSDSKVPGRLLSYRACFDSTIELLDSRSLNSSLYKGITGFALVAQMGPSEAAPEHLIELLSDLDDILAEQYSAIRNPEVDLVNGLAGVLVYAFSRSAYGGSGALKAALREDVFRILSSWRDGSEKSVSKRALDLGVAHGVPGLLLVALGVYGSELSDKEFGVIQMAAQRIWSQSIALSSDAVAFPSFIGGAQPSRLAWCYGGLGIGIILDRVCRLDGSWSERFALVANGILEQFKSGDHGMKDASLCHGFSGAALITNLLSGSSHLPMNIRGRLRDVSREMDERAISLEVPGPAFKSEYNGTQEIRRSLLEGAAGIALANRAIRRGTNVRPWMSALGILE